MAKTKNKTQPTAQSVEDFIAGIENETKRADSEALVSLMERVSGYPPVMWGNIIGFGQYHYVYESGREGDALRVGFAPRAQNFSIYIMPGYQDFDDELSRLGKHKMGKACLYIKRLSDVDMNVLEEIIVKGLAILAKKYPDDV